MDKRVKTSLEQRLKMPFVRPASKGRFHDVIFHIQDFATFGIYRKVNATKRPRWVYYTRMCGSRLWLLIIPIYNTRWRGLAELLISVEGNAKAKDVG